MKLNLCLVSDAELFVNNVYLIFYKHKSKRSIINLIKRFHVLYVTIKKKFIIKLINRIEKNYQIKINNT